MKLYWNDSRQMELLQAPKNKIVQLLLICYYETSSNEFHSLVSNLDIVYHNRIITHNVHWWVMGWNGEREEPALMDPGNETSAL